MINYPFGIQIDETKKEKTNKNSYKNCGLTLESLLNEANSYYISIDKALIYKKPTPIQVVKINKDNIINEAYFKSPSTTDYNGIYKGKYIDYEAKETKSKTSFSLSNIKKHQIAHLLNVEKHCGIAFIIVYFTVLDEIYIYPSFNLNKIVESNKKSISIEEFRTNGHLIKLSVTPKLDYLKIIDRIYF